jgi:hypothetical protein
MLHMSGTQYTSLQHIYLYKQVVDWSAAEVVVRLERHSQDIDHRKIDNSYKVHSFHIVHHDSMIHQDNEYYPTYDTATEGLHRLVEEVERCYMIDLLHLNTAVPLHRKQLHMPVFHSYMLPMPYDNNYSLYLLHLYN